MRTLAGPLLAASLRQVLADRLSATGMRRRTDLLQVATWQLEAGHPEPALLTAAAAAAYRAGDMTSTARLAAGAWDRGASGAAGLLLATALAFSGQYAEADAILTVARDASEDEGMRVRLARAHATIVANALGRPQEAMALLVELEQAVRDRAHAEALRAQRAHLLALAGSVNDALAIAEPLVANTAIPSVAVAASRAAILAHSQAGAYETVIALVQHARAHAEQQWSVGATSVPPEVLRLDGDGARVAMGVLDALPAAGPQPTDVRGIAADRPVAVLSALHTAVADLLRGHPRSAESRIEDVAPVDEGFTGLAAALLATCRALTGRRSEARAALDRAAARDARGALFNPFLDEARAWVLIAEDRPAQAREAVAAATDRAISRGQFGVALALAHLLARIGGGPVAAELASAIPSAIPGPLPVARRVHIAAIAADDAPALEGLTATFADIGAELFAAEAATRAARAFRRLGEPRRAARLMRAAAELASRCEGATTPGLRTASEELAPLSDRELEVATLAASGLSSGEIAGRLVLSTRTIDNHLQHVYQKLGVTSRAQLRAAIATATPAPERPERRR